MDRELVAGARLGDGHHRFERRMHHLTRRERILEHAIGTRESGRDVAVPHLRVERDVRVALPLQMLQVGERAGGLEHVVNDRRTRLRGAHLVEDRFEFVVVDRHEIGARIRDVRVAREHHRHRFADVMHFAEREDGLIVEGRTVIRIGNQREDVFTRDHGVHAGQRARFRRVDRDDARVRHRAAHDLAVQHPGQHEMMDVLDRAGDLGDAFETLDRARDFAQRGADRLHQRSSVAFARSSARRTCTRTISRL